MANKRTAKGEKKENGVGKKKAGEELPDVENIDLEENSEIEEQEQPSSSAPPAPKRKAKAGPKKAKVTKASATGSRKGGRATKMPERFEVPVLEPKPKKKKSGSSGGEYVVEAIRGIMKENGKFKFFIKWENYGEKDCGWEPEANVRNCKSNILKFLDGVTRHVENYP